MTSYDCKEYIKTTRKIKPNTNRSSFEIINDILLATKTDITNNITNNISNSILKSRIALIYETIDIFNRCEQIIHIRQLIATFYRRRYNRRAVATD